jgi:hypothetical protein
VFAQEETGGTLIEHRHKMVFIQNENMPMPHKIKDLPAEFSQIVDKAFAETLRENGITAKDLFVLAVGHCAVGLVLVNLSWLPGSFHALGWTLLAAGLTTMILIRKKL